MTLKQFLLNDNKRKYFNVQNIGLALVCLYIFTCFVAVDIVVSSRFNSITLVLMLGWALLCLVRSWATKKLPLSGYTAWYAVFMVISFVSMLYSKEQSIFSGQFYLMLVSFCVTFAILIFVNNAFSFKTIAYAFIISATVLVVLLYAKGLLSGTESDRLGQDFMGNSNNFAWMMMIATMLGMWLLIYESGKASFKWEVFKKCYLLVKIALIGAILLCLYALMLSGGRKYFVLPFVFLYVLLILKKDKKGKTHFWLYTAIAIVLVVVAYLLIMKVETLYNAIGKRIESFIQGFTGKGEYDGSSAIRSTMREYALSMWIQNPIFGYGFDSFKYYNLTHTGHFYYSHCNYTEMLFNGGIVLFVAYYWIYFLLIRKMRRAQNVNSKYKAFAVGTVVITLLFDLLGISYSVLVMQLVLALSYRALDLNNESSEIVER